MSVVKKEHLWSGQRVTAPFKLPDGSHIDYTGKIVAIDNDLCLVTFDHEQKSRWIAVTNIKPSIIKYNNLERAMRLKALKKENVLLKEKTTQMEQDLHYLRINLEEQKGIASRQARKQNTQTVTIPLCSKPMPIPQRNKPRRDRCCMSW